MLKKSIGLFALALVVFSTSCKQESIANKITDELLIAAAEAIASCVSPSQLNASFIIPSVFDPQVVTKVATAVKKSV